VAFLAAMEQKNRSHASGTVRLLFQIAGKLKSETHPVRGESFSGTNDDEALP